MSLTDEEIDYLLSRYDLSEEKIKRQICAAFVERTLVLSELLMEVNQLVGNSTKYRHVLPPELRDRIQMALGEGGGE